VPAATNVVDEKKIVPATKAVSMFGGSLMACLQNFELMIDVGNTVSSCLSWTSLTSLFVYLCNAGYCYMTSAMIVLYSVFPSILV
jgi:hypothetical protein